MEHRSCGETKACKGCRYWSEMIAKTHGSGVQAMCISDESSERSKYKHGSENCNKWASGHHGAIDSPGESEEIIRLYAEEDEGNANTK